MVEHENYPDTNRLSVLAATILLAYALTPFIDIPIRELEIKLPNAIFYFSFDFPALIALLVAAMAAVGMDWLARGHPYLNRQNVIQHVLLPCLTAWVIGIPLSTIKFSWQWWIVFAFGGILLILLMIAEYIVIDLSDINYSLASMGLIAVSFALFLFMLIAIRGAEARVYILFPVVTLVMALVSLRTLYLRLNGQWCVAWSIGIAFVVGQISIGLQYMPIRPVGYGLLMMIPAYGLTSLVSGMEEKRPWQTLWIEPVIMTAIFLVLALTLRP
jgi:hypothetical protein